MTKIGIFSDIHGNWQALEAVLAVLDNEACDHLICIGDLVGYGASPGPVIEEIRRREIPCLLGNHDEYATLLMDPRIERLREEVKISVEWTQNQLDMDALKWLAQLPKRFDAEDFSLVHGAFGPKPYVYCSNEQALKYNFTYQDVRLGFCGHSHMPLIGVYHEARPPICGRMRSGNLPDAPKIMINVGSVGQPRDLDPRASCVIYELEDDAIRPIRVPYDISEAQRLIRQAGLPEKFAARLGEGK